MIINLENLRAGLRWFSARWGTELLNADYYEIYDARSAGITEQRWRATVDRLSRWHAYRGRRLPNTKAAIMAAGLERLHRIAALYSNVTASSTDEPSIANLDWERVLPLFEIASSIKPGSPVFPSKLCHFLFPKAFTVMDHEATGVFEYEFYWRGMKDEWRRFPEKEEAIEILTGAVESSGPLHPMYPFETKIMELSRVGYNCRRREIP